MARLNNFIDDFQKEHSKLLDLITSFKNAIELSNPSEASEILNVIDSITDGHFNFEQTYLYPRLRRLILEITESLRKEQETMKEFIGKSRRCLEKNKLGKIELVNLLGILPRLSKFFEDCNSLVFLAKKFSKDDIEDLDRRFKECSKTKSLVTA